MNIKKIIIIIISIFVALAIIAALVIWLLISVGGGIAGMFASNEQKNVNELQQGEFNQLKQFIGTQLNPEQQAEIDMILEKGGQKVDDIKGELINIQKEGVEIIPVNFTESFSNFKTEMSTHVNPEKIDDFNLYMKNIKLEIKNKYIGVQN